MLGNRIQYLRERQGLLCHELAERADLDPGELARIEQKNVEELPIPVLLRISGNLRLTKSFDFVSLMQLNGVSREFQAYVVGLPKTGTASLVGIFNNYRSAHEFLQRETHPTIIQYKHNRISEDAFIEFIRKRDVMGCLEMDSAHFNRHYIDILAKEYPEAKFICLIRDCFSWLSSYINFVTHPYREALQSQELGNGLPFDLPRGTSKAKDDLIRNFRSYMDVPLSFWSFENKAMFEKLPPDRSMIIRTYDISSKIEGLARFINIPTETLLKERSHLNRSPYRVKILSHYDQDFLETKFQEHCADLMSVFFPDYSLKDYLAGNPYRAQEPPNRLHSKGQGASH